MYERGWKFPAFFFWKNETFDGKALYVQIESGYARWKKEFDTSTATKRNHRIRRNYPNVS